ncbi:MAG: putative lipoprotein [Labilithrix sp.]|nr:putative lipoprotein [Labilithrix sp.]
MRGTLLGLLARVWLATLRLRVEVHPALAVGDVPWVLSFFHGTQWTLLAWRRRRPTLVMVSHSRDGQLQAAALGVLGFRVVRGSSSRGGARGLAAIVRGLRAGASDAAFAVDGPRGPRGVVKPGAALAAARSGGVLVPMGSAARHVRVFERAWDRFELAWPFSPAVVVLGAPLPADTSPEVLAAAIAEANAAAARILYSSEPARLNADHGPPVQRGP